MDSKIDIPKELIQELRSSSRKRPIKTILRENWGLVEKIDAKLKDADISKNLKPVPAHLTQNFMSTVSVLVNPRKLRRSKSEPPEDEVSDFESDLRDAQRDWRGFFYKYETEIHDFAVSAKKNGGVDFHEELWKRGRIEKLTTAVWNISERVQNKTVSIIPPSRFIFSFISFLASWTIMPVINTPRKLSGAASSLLRFQDRKPVENGYSQNGTQRNGTIANGADKNGAEKNGTTKSDSKISKLIITPVESDKKLRKFHEEMKDTEKFISEKNQEWHEKLNMYQKEISARLEVQEKRLYSEIEKFQQEKEARRQQEEEEFTKRMNQQDTEFHKIIKKIDDERKKLSEEEHKNLLETCKKQDAELLNLLEMTLSPKSVQRNWEEHEDYWSSRLQILRNSLALVRSEFWHFERYFRQQSENPDKNPNFVKTIYEMESASFGQTVTRAQSLINNQHEFFDALFDKYDDDFFLRVLWKITSNIANQLDKVILELWSIAVNSSDFDHFRLRSAVLEIDPCSIPTSWRLKGICHSADPSDYEDALSNSSPSVYSHF
ncbi:hypothetical protein CRE_06067 [Caenorhabditis remanei]|uniref:Uncharacterized protein n=1 Tax=Caenorhabditis remanei TaxID=31234 RepID=E3NAZ8_CAERE|nr:hypothetical protein CRE_06067 [Caenorhabditis remanei]